MAPWYTYKLGAAKAIPQARGARAAGGGARAVLSGSALSPAAPDARWQQLRRDYERDPATATAMSFGEYLTRAGYDPSQDLASDAQRAYGALYRDVQGMDAARPELEHARGQALLSRGQQQGATDALLAAARGEQPGYASARDFAQRQQLYDQAAAVRAAGAGSGAGALGAIRGQAIGGQALSRDNLALQLKERQHALQAAGQGVNAVRAGDIKQLGAEQAIDDDMLRYLTARQQAARGYLGMGLQEQLQNAQAQTAIDSDYFRRLGKEPKTSANQTALEILASISAGAGVFASNSSNEQGNTQPPPNYTVQNYSAAAGGATTPGVGGAYGAMAGGASQGATDYLKRMGY